jgi:hypothetical protein
MGMRNRLIRMGRLNKISRRMSGENVFLFGRVEYVFS